MDRTLSGANIPCQSGPESDSNERVLHIPQSSNHTRTSPSDCLMSYPEHSFFWGFFFAGIYSSAEKQSVYITPHPQLTGTKGSQVHKVKKKKKKKRMCSKINGISAGFFFSFFRHPFDQT